MIKAVSMFSSAGIGELYLNELGIDIVLANELLFKRAEFYKKIYKNTEVLVGDISDEKIFNEYLKKIPKDTKILLATPPCQGASTLGVNKSAKQMMEDERNHLIFKVFDIIDINNFDYILIENVPRYLDVFIPYNNEYKRLNEVIISKYSEKYNIKIDIYNAKDYEVPQSRPRAIIRMYKKHLKWNDPKTSKEIILSEAIGHLPSLESGEVSNLKHHYAKIHNPREIECMKFTPTGQSAMKNEIYYPKKENGDRIKGFHNTYKRMAWNNVAPARTMNSGNIGSHNNVHPGRLKEDGTYTDARVLTLRELFIISSLPEEWNYPEEYSDSFIRKIIGESIPPKLLYNIMKGIKDD